ncbi:hypothetical protein L3Q82_021122 [Scortum barcoo]|uniref:Uncharacterized protein n=1 Tax=Scortum barcoo TaxID=214431 RepID=A0ACB8X3C1_9TELE|nr:hypothetical protein L3Q82_021122 [Scortum barcoo]
MRKPHGCIRAPLLPRFTRGNTTAQNAFPPSCCSVLSVFSAGCHGSRADSAGFNIDQESRSKKSPSAVGTEQCNYNNYVYWYQKKDTETFTRIIRIDKSNGGIYSGYNHPQKDDFSAANTHKGWELEIQKVKLAHSATYYCSCYKSDLHSLLVSLALMLLPQHTAAKKMALATTDW